MENITFTKREKDVIALAKKGYTYQEMAIYYDCTTFAINDITKKLYKKLGVRSMGRMLAEVKKLQDKTPVEEAAREEWMENKMWGGEVEYNYFLKGFELATKRFR